MLKEVEAGTYKDKQYMKKEEVSTAYKHALDSDSPTVDACFDEVKTVHLVTDEYLEEVRSNPIYSHMVDSIVDENVSHPQVRSMRDNKVLQLRLHKKASTPNQLITDITSKRTVNDRLKALEQEVTDLKCKVDSVSVSQDNTEMGVERLLEYVELPKDHNKTKAIALKQKGHKIKNIAEVLGVTERTVKRWTQKISLVGDTPKL
jgi:DNA-binding NarL/FixJ family response regulator